VPTAQVTPLGRGLHRVTLPLPFRLSHVHCYALEDAAGWTLVDAGLGTPDAADAWREALAELGSPAVARIVITHFHPDHVGAAATLAELTGAEVWQSADDERQARRVWGDQPTGMGDYLRAHGVPEQEAAEADRRGIGSLVRLPASVRHVSEGDAFDAGGATWRFIHLPGHADWQHGLLDERGGRLIAGDHLLAQISPQVGLYPDCSRDPLGDYLTALGRVARLAPAIAYPGHGEPIEDVPGRAAAIDGHHAQRLHDHRDILAADGPSDAYGVSCRVFGAELSAFERRLAVTETLAHLVRLEQAGAVTSGAEAGVTLWEAA
jgi:glyoxylase-like metal-dependent hydrolase (beta-lactamase superfamily II)